MTYSVLMGTLNPTHSLTHTLDHTDRHNHNALAHALTSQSQPLTAAVQA